MTNLIKDCGRETNAVFHKTLRHTVLTFHDIGFDQYYLFTYLNHTLHDQKMVLQSLRRVVVKFIYISHKESINRNVNIEINYDHRLSLHRLINLVKD